MAAFLARAWLRVLKTFFFWLLFWELTFELAFELVLELCVLCLSFCYTLKASFILGLSMKLSSLLYEVMFFVETLEAWVIIGLLAKLDVFLNVRDPSKIMPVLLSLLTLMFSSELLLICLNFFVGTDSCF